MAVIRTEPRGKLMEKYATIKSDRTDKATGKNITRSLGGNRFLTVEVSAQNAGAGADLYTLCVTDNVVDLYKNGKLEKRIKANKQKDEECTHQYCDDDGNCHACGVNVFK